MDSHHSPNVSPSRSWNNVPRSKWLSLPALPTGATLPFYIEKPDFNPTSLDLVTDQNNLRKLTQAISEERIEDFRIDVRVVGSTLLFTRWEKHAHERIGPNDFRGYGHSFEREFSTYGEGMEESSGHHRIINTLLGLWRYC